VVVEFDGTTTVVLAGGGGLLLLTQPESSAAAATKLHRIFIIASKSYPSRDFADNSLWWAWAWGVSTHESINPFSVIGRPTCWGNVFSA
jgi:hypothetical protein